jgi:hypothetical protein
MTRLRLKGPPSDVRVVLAFAMLSAITSSLNLFAVNPVAAILIELKIPILTSISAAVEPRIFIENETLFHSLTPQYPVYLTELKRGGLR